MKNVLNVTVQKTSLLQRTTIKQSLMKRGHGKSTIECDENGRTLFTRTQLKEMGIYFKRPASELIFVTRSMHWKLHREIYEKRGKIVGKKYGKIGGKIVGKKNSISILQFTKDGTLIKEWPSAYEAKRQLGIPQSNICNCLKGRLKSAGGYIWRYK